MIANAQRICNDRQSRIYRPTRREKAPIDYIKIVDVVSLAIDVQCARQRIMTEAHGTILVSNPGEGNLLADKDVPVE